MLSTLQSANSNMASLAQMTLATRPAQQMIQEILPLQTHMFVDSGYLWNYKIVGQTISQKNGGHEKRVPKVLVNMYTYIYIYRERDLFLLFPFFYVTNTHTHTHKSQNPKTPIRQNPKTKQPINPKSNHWGMYSSTHSGWVGYLRRGLSKWLP